MPDSYYASVSIVLLVLHSCHIGVACVALMLLVPGTCIVKYNRSVKTSTNVLDPDYFCTFYISALSAFMAHCFMTPI